MRKAEKVLQQTRDSFLLIDTNIIECEHLRSIAARLSSMNTDQSCQLYRSAAAYTTAVKDLISLEKEVNDETSDYVNTYREARLLIQKLPNKLEKTILKRYYLNCQTIKIIAEDLHYSERWISQKKTEAIIHLQEIVENCAV